MNHDERQPEDGGKFDFLNEGLQGFVAILAISSGEVDQVTGVAENAMKGVLRQFDFVEIEISRFGGRAKPAHVVFHEDLDGVALDAAPSLQRTPEAAAGGHVGAEE